MRPDRLGFGIFLAPFHPLHEDPTAALDRDMQLVEHLDQLGYDEAWIGEPTQVVLRSSPRRRFLSQLLVNEHGTSASALASARCRITIRSSMQTAWCSWTT